MRVIDLLNKIANEEEVPVIKYRKKTIHWNKEKARFEDKDGMNTLYEFDFSELLDEIEVIEQKDNKIEKLDEDVSIEPYIILTIKRTINKLIDKVDVMENAIRYLADEKVDELSDELNKLMEEK